MPPKSAAERKAESRARAVARGLCIVCAKRKARAGKTTCRPCNEAAKERVRAAREAAAE